MNTAETTQLRPKAPREVETRFVGLRMPANVEILEIEGYAIKLRFADGSVGWSKWSGFATLIFDDYCGHGHRTSDTAWRCRRGVAHA